MLDSGRQSVFNNRIGWCRTYLKKAGLIESPSRARFVITEEGKKVLESGEEITNEMLMRYPRSANFSMESPAKAQIMPKRKPERKIQRRHRRRLWTGCRRR